MKKSSVVMAILLVTIAPFAIILPMAAPAKAWGLQTHMFMVSEAMSQITNASWYEAYEYYSPEVLAGCTTPDQAWQDWDNHLYYPETGEHNAPTAAARWFNFSRDNFTAGNWEAGFFAVGVMTHYFSDPCIPVHTDEYWPGHAGYESDINAHLADLTLGTPEEVIISNVSQLVIDCATYSHQYYDTVYAAYADEESEALETNAEIKTLTEDCLSLAINGCLSLFYTLSQYCDAPEITITYNYVALFDYAHSNDYIDYSGEDLLTSVNITLARNHFEMKKQVSAFDASALADVDLLVITCALDAYSTAELAAIADWASIGNRTILLTGRGDFSEYQDTARPNRILNAIGSHIRINDDNVYMQGTYGPWYNDLTVIPPENETMNLTLSVTTITMYSPSNLYFTDDDPVLPIIYADT
ncbi:MAG: zinc dependent phospholipase C family protein, partial [Candidatus Thorarchaeota archaeon]